jgi:hypothetical protein
VGTILANYTLSGGQTLALDGSLTTLTGSDILDGIVEGGGTLALAAGATAALSGLLLEDSATFSISGTVDQVGQVQFGASAADTVDVTIAAGGSYVLLIDDGITAPGTAIITNNGLFEKAGTDGTSTIGGDFVNRGTVLDTIGVIDFATTLSNDGIIIAAGAGITVAGTLTETSGQHGGFDIETGSALAISGTVDAGQTIAFTGTSGTLRLSDPAGFAGTVTGFAPGDTIDLAGIAANVISYSGGVLTVQEEYDTGVPATLDIAATYHLAVPGITDPAALTLVNDNAGGTEIVLNHAGPAFTNPIPEIITDDWTVDASGNWSTGADWFQVVPEPAPIFSETLDVQPGIDNDAVIVPTGSTPFTVTYNETDTVNQLSGNTLATLDLLGGTLAINQGGNWGGSFFNSGGTLDAVSGWYVSGATSLASGATDEVDSGTFAVGAGTLAGTVTGQGEFLLIGGNNFTIAPGFTITSSIFDLAVDGDGFGSNTTLDTNLTYAGLFALNDYSGNAANLFLNLHTLTLTGQADLNGYISGSGGVTLAGTSEISGLTINNSADVTISGTVIQDGQLTTGTGTAPDDTVLAITRTGTWDLVQDTSINGYGNSTITNAGLIEKTGGTGDSNFGGDLFVDTGRIRIATGELSIGASSNTIAGSVSGSGELIFDGGPSFVLAPGATILTPIFDLAVNGDGFGSNTTLDASLSYGGTFLLSDYSGNAANLSLNGFTLTLTGQNDLNGDVFGSGELALGGTSYLSGFGVANSATILVTGLALQTGGVTGGTGTSPDDTLLAIAAGGTWDIIDDSQISGYGGTTISNKGLLEETGGTGNGYVSGNILSSGTLDVASGQMVLSGAGTSTLAGTLTGAGSLLLQGSTFLIDPAVLTISVLTDNANDIAVEESLTYAGVLVDNDEIDLAGHTLTLSGQATLNSLISGPGTLVLSNHATLNNATISALVDVTGTVEDNGNTTYGPNATSTISVNIAAGALYDQAGYTQFGFSSTDQIQVGIAVGATYDITGNTWTDNPNSNDNGVTTITNAGLLEKTASTGTSTIFTDLVTTGTVLVASGVLDLESITSSTLDGTITGAGGLILGRDDILLDPSVLNVPVLSLYANDVTLGEDFSYGGTFTHGAGEVSLAGYTLTLSGTAALDNDYIGGLGTLVLAGQASLSGFTGESAVDITGTVDQAGGVGFGATSTDTIQVTIAANAIYDLTGNNWTNNPNSNDNGVATITNAGLLEATSGTGTSTLFTDLDNTGTVLVAAGGVLDLESITASTLDGTITGAGGLILGRDDIVLDPSLLNVPALSVYASDVALGENISYAGAFTHGSGDISLDGYTLTLSGTAALDNDYIGGLGTLVLAGQASLSGFTGESAVDITGTVDQAGGVGFGATSTDTIQVTIAAGGVYDLTGNNWTNNPNSNDNGIATITNAGLLEATSGTGTSTIFADVANFGTVVVSDGSVLNLDYTVTGSGAMSLQTGSVLVLSSAVSAGQAIAFAGTSALSLGDPGQFDGVIAGLAPADQIDLTNIGFANGGTTSLSRSDLLSVIDNGSTFSLQLAGDYSSQYFHLSAAQGGGLEITENTTPCYCRGTSILTTRGEVKVEHLELGDHVITYAGLARPIRWIGQRSYTRNAAAGNRDILPVRIRAGALADGVPHRDLLVSPLHAMYIQDLLIPAWSLINGISILQDSAPDGVSYYHVELETHDVILAEGAASETFIDDDSRRLFDNAAGIEGPSPAQYCAPRIEDGELLEAVRRAIAARVAQPQLAEPA